MSNENNIDINNPDEALNFFSNPELDARRNQRNIDDAKRAQYASVASQIGPAGIYQMQTGTNNHQRNTSNQNIRLSEKDQKQAKKVHQKSIKTSNNPKKTEDSNRQVKVIDTTKLTQKIAIILCTTVSAISLIIGGYLITRNKIGEIISKPNIIQECLDKLVAKEYAKLLANGLAGIDGNGNVIVFEETNDKEDYTQLGIDNPLDAYVYSKILSPEEWETDLITAATYDENGFDRNYISSQQFYNINGFNDSTGAPSYEIYANWAEENIYTNSETILSQDSVVSVVEPTKTPGKTK